jgi:F0F1-type ATP synthase membrane subunit b/b'
MTLFQDPHTWVLVSFIVFVVGVARPFFRNVVAQLDARRTLIADQIKAVADIYKAAKDLHSQKTTQLDQGHHEAKQILQKAEEDAEALRVGMERQLQENLRKKKAIYDNMIEAMEHKNLVAMEQKVVETALAVIKAMLRDDISPNDQHKIIGRKITLLRTYH